MLFNKKYSYGRFGCIKFKFHYFKCKKLFKVPGFFQNFQSQGFKIFKHKLSNSKLFRDSNFLETLIVHTYM